MTFLKLILFAQTQLHSVNRQKIQKKASKRPQKSQKGSAVSTKTQALKTQGASGDIEKKLFTDMQEQKNSKRLQKQKKLKIKKFLQNNYI